MTKRGFLASAAAALGVAFIGLRAGSSEAKRFAVTYGDAEWKRRLSPMAYRVLRQEATEKAFSSPLNNEKRAGIFLCAGCGQPLFSSAAKFESGTGWPSFTAPLPDAVETKKDYAIIIPRTEVHCDRCGGHLGHVFGDGPPPTGQRYCMNGAAMTFRPAQV